MNVTAVNSAKPAEERAGLRFTCRPGQGPRLHNGYEQRTRTIPLPSGLPTPECLLEDEGFPPPDRGLSLHWPDNADESNSSSS